MISSSAPLSTSEFLLFHRFFPIFCSIIPTKYKLIPIFCSTIPTKYKFIPTFPHFCITFKFNRNKREAAITPLHNHTLFQTIEKVLPSLLLSFKSRSAPNALASILLNGSPKPSPLTFNFFFSPRKKRSKI